MPLAPEGAEGVTMDWTTLALIAGGLLGAFLRSMADNDQKTWSTHTVTDVVIGGVLGGLAPLVATVPGNTLLQKALVVCFGTYAGVNFTKDLLGKFNISIPAFTPKAVLLPLLLPLLALTACTTPISGNLTRDIQGAATPFGLPSGHLGGVVLQGLQDATFNLDQAVLVGALDATDPAPGCFHGMLTQLGVEVPPGTVAPASFTPKVSDLISVGSVLYIRAKQIQKLRGGGISVPPSCKELVAQFMLDAAAASANTLPGGGLLPKLQ